MEISRSVSYCLKMYLIKIAENEEPGTGSSFLLILFLERALLSTVGIRKAETPSKTSPH